MTPKFAKIDEKGATLEGTESDTVHGGFPDSVKAKFRFYALGPMEQYRMLDRDWPGRPETGDRDDMLW